MVGLGLNGKHSADLLSPCSHITQSMPHTMSRGGVETDTVIDNGQTNGTDERTQRHGDAIGSTVTKCVTQPFTNNIDNMEGLLGR